MKAPIVIVGMGQLGAVFAEGFLRLGHPVFPVRRGDSFDALTGMDPALVVVAVAEDDLGPALATVPEPWRDRVLLLQNELRPDQWRAAAVGDPTLAIIWFEKRAGLPLDEVRRSVVAGPQAALAGRALVAVGVEPIVKSEGAEHPEVIHELILKNLYILGLNLTGLSVDGTAGALLGEHAEAFRRVLDDVIALERAMLDSAEPNRGAEPGRIVLDQARLERELVAAIESSPTHGLKGRSAPRRLERSLAHGRTVGVNLEHLEDLGRRILKAETK